MLTNGKLSRERIERSKRGNKKGLESVWLLRREIFFKMKYERCQISPVTPRCSSKTVVISRLESGTSVVLFSMAAEAGGRK